VRRPRRGSSARFINDRVHANIQKDGTFSVIPRIRGGVTTPDELRRIADVADKYRVPMVKITGSQRIDLLGVRRRTCRTSGPTSACRPARPTPRACAW
jgi:nitrite reductase (NADH) large subunit